MPTISNPILRGFNPDPSIVRVGDDYYIATSTFEWYPGVQIHHSRDLVHWRLLTRPLRRASQLDMRGDPDSCGIWAPCLTHADGRFWLIYTDVKRYGRASAGVSGASLRDFHNYLVTCDTIDGEWSDPIPLNSSGFDPSLFHDDDGRKYLVNMLWDHRPNVHHFGGIVLQEYSVAEQRLVGERVNIFAGTSIGFTEAPHLYKRDGWYYLITAEGGTFWGHAVTMARSRNITGPYELHPGHVRADVATSSRRAAAEGGARRSRRDAEWRDVDRVSLRPAAAQSRAMHARSRDGDPADGVGRRRLAAHDRRRADPAAHAARARSAGARVSGCARARPTSTTRRCRSTSSGCARRIPRSCSASRRVPVICGCTDASRSGSLFRQSLVARRQQSHCYSASTVLEFEPQHFQQAAGLVCYYGGAKFHYLFVSRDEKMGKYLQVMSALPEGVRADDFSRAIALPDGKRIELRVEVDEERMLFAYRVEGTGDAWQWLPEQFDASILSDEAAAAGTANFTGAFVGMACQDIAGTALHADFDWFEYREREYVVDPR